MATTIWGVVKEGCVVPSSPLPEGAHFEIRLTEAHSELPEDLREEIEAWNRAGAGALDLMERLAIEGEADEAR